MAGFPGCVRSTDATHVILERGPLRLRQLHLGYKLAHTARTYNMTVNHRNWIRSKTKGHSSHFNDKTLVLYDDLCKQYTIIYMVINSLSFSKILMLMDKLLKLNTEGAI